MKPFISTNKIFSINVSRADENFIETCQNSTSEPHTVVFYNSSEAGEEGRSLLDKILAAANIDSSKFIAVDIASTPSIRLRFLHQLFPTLKTVLIFALPLTSIGLNAKLSPYNIHKIGPYEILSAHSLSDLQENEQLKRELWNNLKLLFLS